MKKSSFIFLLTLLSLTAMAQNNGGGFVLDQSFLNGLASIFVFYLALTFIIKIISLIQDNRLKSKMIEKGVSEEVVEQILRPADNNKVEQLTKWILHYLVLEAEL